MNRRDFMKIGAPLGMTPFLLNSLPVRAFTSPELSALTCEYSDRAIVLVYLGGGNDGINNLIPVEQYDLYANIRPNLRLPYNKIIPLDQQLRGEQAVSLHPAMTPVKDIYEQGKLNIIQGVGYPFPNRSHFKSSDIMMTGGDGMDQDHTIQTGWMGRYLESYYEGFEEYLSQELPDPLGVILGGPSLGFHTHSQHSVEVELSNVGGFLQNVLSANTGIPFGNFPDTTFGDQIRHIMQTENSLNKYAKNIDGVYRKGRNTQSYPHSRGLGYQLKMVARLLSGGSRTKIFITTLASFDTHANQVVNNDPVSGWHSSLLGDLSQALQVFQNDLKELNVEDRVLTVVFSEFGRKITENANKGTDHGTLGPMYIMGSQVSAGMTGKNLLLNEDLLNGGAPDVDKQLQYDYRQIFGTILQDWLGARDEDLEQAKFLDYIANKPSIIEAHSVVDSSSYGCKDTSYKTRVNFGELGRTRILQQRVNQWHDIPFKSAYSNPVVIISPVSYRGAQPCLTRIQTINETHFTYKVDEWGYMDGRHLQEEICYMVMEEGVYFMENEVMMMAGSSLVNHQWIYVSFPASFEFDPVVFAHCNSVNDPQPVVVRIKEVTKEGFWMCLQSEEKGDPHYTPEHVGWMAVESYVKYQGNRMEAGNTGKIVTSDWYQIAFSNEYNHTPYCFTSIQTIEDNDTATLRWEQLNKEGLEVFIQEETSKDTETTHQAEEIGYLAIESSLLSGQRSEHSSPQLQLTSRDSSIDKQGEILWEAYSETTSKETFIVGRKLLSAFQFYATNTRIRYKLGVLRGIIVPPTTGKYKFWLSGTEGARLYLNPKGTEDFGKAIASIPYATRLDQWEFSSEQVSNDMYLKKGHKYLLYVEYPFRSGSLGVAVGWKMPNGKLERPMRGRWVNSAEKEDELTTFDLQSVNSSLPGDKINASKNHISINGYPNPFHHELTLLLGNVQEQDVEIQIIDAAGRVAYHEQKFIHNRPVHVQTNNLTTGMYTVRISSGQQISAIHMTKV